MGWMAHVLNPGVGKRFLSSPKHPDYHWGSPSLFLNGCLGSFLGVKWPGCEVDHSPPSSVEVKNEWSCTSPPPICASIVWTGKNLPLMYKSRSGGSLLRRSGPTQGCSNSSRKRICRFNN